VRNLGSWRGIDFVGVLDGFGGFEKMGKMGVGAEENCKNSLKYTIFNLYLL
jgi:hypothetical protein